MKRVRDQVLDDQLRTAPLLWSYRFGSVNVGGSCFWDVGCPATLAR
jgi:hypothetical protein